MADLNVLEQQFHAQGVRVVGVSVDASDEHRVRRFAEEAKLGFLVAHDPAQRIRQMYNVVGVPETFVIGGDGRLAWRRVGNLHAVLDSVRAIVARAVATR